MVTVILPIPITLMQQMAPFIMMMSAPLDVQFPGLVMESVMVHVRLKLVNLMALIVMRVIMLKTTTLPISATLIVQMLGSEMVNAMDNVTLQNVPLIMETAEQTEQQQISFLMTPRPINMLTHVPQLATLPS